MADVKLSQLAAASPASRAAGAALWTMKGHIEGVKLEWVSGTSLRVTSGSAYIQSLGYAIDVPAAITKGSLVLAANTWYHVYLFVNAGTADIEIVTTAPAAPYSGTARSKTSDTSRRYLGSVMTDSSGTLWGFLQSGDQVLYRNKQDGAPFRVLNGGADTAETTVDLSGVAPVTSRCAVIKVTNGASTAQAMKTGTSDDSASGPPLGAIASFPSGAAGWINHPLDAAQAMTYWFVDAPTSGGGYIDVYGYTFER